MSKIKKQKQSLNDFLGPIEKSQQKILTKTTKSLLAFADADQSNLGLGLRTQIIMQKYNELQTTKQTKKLTDSEKVKKIKHFINRSNYFQTQRQKKLSIKQRIKQIYDTKNDQVYFYPHHLSRQLDPICKLTQQWNSIEDQDITIAEQETIYDPYY